MNAATLAPATRTRRILRVANVVIWSTLVLFWLNALAGHVARQARDATLDAQLYAATISHAPARVADAYAADSSALALIEIAILPDYVRRHDEAADRADFWAAVHCNTPLHLLPAARAWAGSVEICTEEVAP